MPHTLASRRAAAAKGVATRRRNRVKKVRAGRLGGLATAKRRRQRVAAGKKGARVRKLCGKVHAK